jgi:hypothetical protein
MANSTGIKYAKLTDALLYIPQLSRGKIHPSALLLFVLTLCLLLQTSCKKESFPDTMAGELKRIIAQEKVSSVVTCCLACECQYAVDSGIDYSFIGENMLRIGNSYHNLYDLHSYEIVEFTASDRTTKKRMILLLKE